MNEYGIKVNNLTNAYFPSVYTVLDTELTLLEFLSVVTVVVTIIKII